MTTVEQAATTMKAAAEVAKPPLHVQALVVSNFMKIIAAEVRPDGNVVEIVGANGSGKSSLLNAMWFGIKGKAVAPPKPIREGAEETSVFLQLGRAGAVKYTVTRTVTRRDGKEDTYSLKFEDSSGKVKRPQETLDALVSELAFDPMRFSRAETRVQFEILCSLVPGLDLGTIERLNKSDFDKRTILNARAKESRIKAGPAPVGAPPQKINENDLVDEIQRSADFNASIAEEQKARLGRIARREECAREIASYEARLADLKSELALVDAQIAGFEVKPLPAPINVTEVRERLAEAKRLNGLFSDKARHDELTLEAGIAEFDSQMLTEARAARIADMHAAIAKADLPIPGLTIGGDDEVLLDGLPYGQANAARQIHTSVVIGSLLAPHLRLAVIEDGSLLDRNTMALIQKSADELDVMVFVERLEATTSSAVLIENGYSRQRAIAGVNDALDH